MKALSIILILTLGFPSMAADWGRQGPGYIIDSSVVDPTLPDGDTHFIFTLDPQAGMLGSKLVIGINGFHDTLSIGENMRIHLITEPGIYEFDFFWNKQYAEISTEKIKIKNKHQTYIRLFFRTVESQNYILRKPVIYLYPANEIDLEVKVRPNGKFTFTYPAYNDGWKLKASPNGDLTMNDKAYKYLFWEAEQMYDFNAKTWEEGFKVQSKDITSFLEKYLNQYGFNSKERADFITYWAPIMSQQKECVVHFVVNEACDKYAQLEITPTPKNLNRFYMFWSPVHNPKDFYYLRPQDVKPISRLGFTVLEWGGAQIDWSPSEEKNDRL